MAFLDGEVKRATRQLTGDPGEGSELYYTGDWAERRMKYGERWDWYEGVEWKRTLDDQTDPVTGKPPLQWPLQVNPIAKVCRIHRAVMMGMQPNIIDDPPVSTIVSRRGLDQSQREQAEALEGFINRVWWSSNAAATQFEAALLTQIYGGHAFRITWEPFNKNLPYRIGVRSFKNPGYIHVVATNPLDEWEILEAYVGYEIPSSVAKTMFAVISDTEKVLYLEHWTRESYRITVDGKVPVVKMGDLTLSYEGENKWGVVPLVYIPHERDGRYYGRSLVDDDSSLVGLAKELNARLADKGEALQQGRSMPWVRNTRVGGMGVRDIQIGGRIVDFIDLGDAGRLPGTPEPGAGVLEPQGVSQSVAEFPSEIWAEIRRQGDIASVAMGDDDVSGGRITGPVTAYRMWPTMQHTMVERAFFTTGLRKVAQIVLTVALDKIGNDGSGYGYYKVPPPPVDEDMREFDFAASWRPMIPIEEMKQAETLIAEFKAGAISLVSYLRARGVQDPEAEAERIWEERAREAEATAKAKAEAQARLSPEGQEEETGDQNTVRNKAGERPRDTRQRRKQ